jgi:hypothetical protein
MEGTLKKYKNILTGYKPIYARILTEEAVMLIARDVSKLRGSDAVRLDLKKAKVDTYGTSTSTDSHKLTEASPQTSRRSIGDKFDEQPTPSLGGDVNNQFTII